MMKHRMVDCALTPGHGLECRCSEIVVCHSDREPANPLMSFEPPPGSGPLRRLAGRFEQRIRLGCAFARRANNF